METNHSYVPSALSAADAGRDAAASFVHSPWWYYPASGLVFGGLGLSFALGNALIQLAALVASLAAGRLLQWGYRKLTGVWLSGLRSGPATIWSIVWVIIVISVMVAGWLTVASLERSWPAWAAAALILVVTVLYGHFFERAVRDHLRPAVE